MKEANIVDLTLGGKGVADQAGKVVFVPFTITGEYVRYEPKKKKKSFDEAKLLEVIKPSLKRIQPRCKYFTVCGGCATQHISNDAQIKFKQHAVLETIRRVGNVTPQTVYPPAIHKVWGYRRRARLAVKYVFKKERVLVGFREKDAPFVTDMWSCEVLHPSLASLIGPFSYLISSLSIKDKVPQIECCVAENVTALVFRVLDTPLEDDLNKLKVFEKEHGVQIYLQTKGLDTVAPLSAKQSSQALFYILSPFDVRLEFLPIDFIQVHHEMNQKMVQQAVRWLNLSSNNKVLDLFCGLGNFSLPIATKAQKVLGIEGDDGLVIRAKHNAQINQIPNVAFLKADLFKVDKNCSWLGENWDAVVIDPPRAGAREVIELLGSIGPEKILYISCHPATLARDADIVVNQFGYKLERLNVLDMFPQTGHVETMVLFVRKP